MFISQVIFESAPANEQTLKDIVAGKVKSAAQAAGVVSAECWRTSKADSVGYAAVTRWESREQFLTWLKDSHKSPHQGGGDGLAITKTGFQFEIVELD